MDGYANARDRRLRSDQTNQIHQSVTASALEEERTVVKKAGCDDFLRKPFREADIFAIMNKHIGMRYIYEAPTPSDSLTTEEGEQNVLTAAAIQALPKSWVANLK